MTPIQKLAKLALENPELRDDLVPLIREAAKSPAKKEWSSKGRKRKDVKTKERQQGKKEIRDQQREAGTSTTDIYPNKIDHGYSQALSGGTDVMKRLQDKFLIEQGRSPRESNPRLAFCRAVQRGVAKIARESHQAREAVQEALLDYMKATGETVVAASAINAILDEAVGVALDPQRIGQIVARHTAKGVKS